MEDVDGGAGGRGAGRVEDAAGGAHLTHFAPGEAHLEEAHLRWLRGFAGRLGGLTGDIFIVGLVDPLGREPDGRALALRRARAVYRFLRGASPTFPFVDVHVTTSGRGVEGSAIDAAARSRGVALFRRAPGERGPPWLRRVVQERPEPGTGFYVRLLALAASARDAPGEADAREGSGGHGAAGKQPRAAFEIGDGRWSVLYGLSAARAGVGSRRPGAGSSGEAAPPRPPAGATGPPGGEVPASRGRASGRPDPDPATVLGHGPWHRFRSSLELTVEGFQRSPVMASGLSGAGGEVRIHVVRPPLSLSPFRAGGEVGLRALRAAAPAGADPAPGARVQLGVLDSGGRQAYPHSIPPAIRDHLRRGGAPGPRSREEEESWGVP